MTVTASTIDEADLLELYRMYRHVYTAMHAAQSTPPLVANTKGSSDHHHHTGSHHHAEEDDVALEAAGRTASELVTMALGLGRRMSQRMDRRYGYHFFQWLYFFFSTLNAVSMVIFSIEKNSKKSGRV